MYLIKPGHTYTDNNYKYQPRKKAIERMYFTIMEFLSHEDVKFVAEKVIRYKNNYSVIAISDQFMIKRSLNKIKSWIADMRPRFEPSEEVLRLQDRGRQSKADKKLVEKKRKKYIESLQKYNSAHAFLNFFERQVNLLLYEGDKLIPIAHLYGSLKSDQQAQFDQLIKMMDDWVRTTEEAIAPYLTINQAEE